MHLFWPKNRFCANFNQTGPVGFRFSLVLGPHENDNNIDLHTDRQTFSNHIFGSEDLQRMLPLKNQHISKGEKVIRITVIFIRICWFRIGICGKINMFSKDCQISTPTIMTLLDIYDAS